VPEAAPWSWAIVANFCADGSFLLASGAMYKGKADMALGASDGLSIYRGTWQESEAGLEVRYRLVDYEIPPVGDPAPLKREANGLVTRDGDALTIPIVVFAKELRYESLSFVASSAVNPTVVPRFAQCGPNS